MPELRLTQEAFAEALIDASLTARAAATLLGTPEQAVARLAIYRGNMAAAARKALGGAFPVVAKIVGAGFFEGLARDYLRRYPPVEGDLNVYGENFAEFVAAFPHTRDLPYLSDVARMEWLAHRAYYAADAEPPDPLRAASIPAENMTRMRLVPAPACGLLESRWPLARIWEIHQDDYEGEFSVDLEAGLAWILVHRPQFMVRVEPLSRGAHRFLDCSMHGTPVGNALESALAAQPDFDLTSVLANWIATGVITGFESCNPYNGNEREPSCSGNPP